MATHLNDHSPKWPLNGLYEISTMHDLIHTKYWFQIIFNPEYYVFQLLDRMICNNKEPSEFGPCDLGSQITSQLLMSKSILATDTMPWKWNWPKPMRLGKNYIHPLKDSYLSRSFVRHCNNHIVDILEHLKNDKWHHIREHQVHSDIFSSHTATRCQSQ